MKSKIKILLLCVLTITAAGCFGKKEDDKEVKIQDYNLELEKKQAELRDPCDAIAVKEYVKENYPPGTYLVHFDRTSTYEEPKPAVLYYDYQPNYIFALITKSKPGERYIEPKNVIGYESSFVNLDSTKLGTAFFYLTLFKCFNGDFSVVWEQEVPTHGGFNNMTLKRWSKKNLEYIQLNFEDGIISGFRNFNFFFVDGISNPPHLLETYGGIAHKRTLANINNDIYPDYYEYRFSDSLDYNRLIDSVAFYWDIKKKFYVTDRNSRWKRKF